MAEQKMKITYTSEFMTLVCDGDEYNLRAILQTPVEVEYLIERLKEIHNRMLEPAIPAVQQEQAHV